MEVASKFKTKQRGFTIAELLLVIAVIAFLAGIGGGIYVGTYKRMLAEKAAKEFLLAAKYARITAVERQSPCEMALDADKSRFSLLVYELNEDTGQSEQVPVRNLYFKPVQFGGDVKFEDIRITPISSEEETKTSEEEKIVFSAKGTAQSAVIQIGDGRNHYTVSICAATGRATMYFGTAEVAKANTIDLDEEL